MTERAYRVIQELEEAGERGLNKFELGIRIKDPQPARAIQEARQDGTKIRTVMEKHHLWIFGNRKQARYFLVRS